MDCPFSLKAADFFLLRTPSFPTLALVSVRAAYESGSGVDKSSPCQSRFFQEALFLASRSLYQRLSEQAASDNAKLDLPLARYLYRMSQRSTPFGIFAGVTVGKAGEACRLVVEPSETSKRDCHIDLGVLLNWHARLLADIENALPLLRASSITRNSSGWQAPDGLRLIETRGENIFYKLARIESTPAIAFVWDALEKSPLLFTDLAELLADSFEVVLSDAEKFLADLVGQQVLVPLPQVCATGEDSRRAFLLELDGISGASSSATLLLRTSEDLSSVGTDPDQNLRTYHAALASLHEGGVQTGDESIVHADLRKIADEVELPKTVLAELTSDIWEARRLLFGPSNGELDKFAAEFTERYGDETVPLLEVLDPDFGIELGSISNTHAPLLNRFRRKLQPGDTRPSEIDTLMFDLAQDAWLEGQQEIRLIPEQIEALGSEVFRPPSSFAFMGTLNAESLEALSNGKYMFELAGISAPGGMSLLGRFCSGNPELAKKVRAFIDAYECDVDDKIVAEVAHMPEGRAGNVLLRPVLRKYEIGYMGQPGIDCDHQIPASDLYVACRNGHVVLFSKKLRKTIIPRITNAHSFHAFQNLPIYRFLGLLQFQNEFTARPLWGQLSEKAHFLPGLRYRKIQLSRPRWMLKKDQIQAILSRGSDDGKILLPFRNMKHLQHIRLKQGDNYIELDLHQRLDRALLLDECRRNQSLVVEDASQEAHELVTDRNGNRLRHEIVVPVSCANPAALQPTYKIEVSDGRLSTPPGGNWLYACIFGGPEVIDRLIVDVFPIFAQKSSEAGCRNPFFIRYWKSGSHLRLRVEGEPKILWQHLRAELEMLLLPYRGSRAVFRFEYATYYPEFDRYGGKAGMAASEAIFSSDSLFVSQALRAIHGQEDSENLRWRLALASIIRLLRGFDFSFDDEISMLNSLANGYVAEFRFTKPERDVLNEKYRQYRSWIDEAVKGTPYELASVEAALQTRDDFLREPIKDLKSAVSGESLPAVVQSLIHMTANRIFMERGREQELVLLHAIAKSQTSIRGRQKFDAQKMNETVKTV